LGAWPHRNIRKQFRLQWKSATVSPYSWWLRSRLDRWRKRPIGRFRHRSDPVPHPCFSRNEFTVARTTEIQVHFFSPRFPGRCRLLPWRISRRRPCE